MQDFQQAGGKVSFISLNRKQPKPGKRLPSFDPAEAKLFRQKKFGERANSGAPNSQDGSQMVEVRDGEASADKNHPSADKISVNLTCFNNEVPIIKRNRAQPMTKEPDHLSTTKMLYGGHHGSFPNVNERAHSVKKLSKKSTRNPFMSTEQ